MVCNGEVFIQQIVAALILLLAQAESSYAQCFLLQRGEEFFPLKRSTTSAQPCAARHPLGRASLARSSFPLLRSRSRRTYCWLREWLGHSGRAFADTTSRTIPRSHV